MRQYEIWELAVKAAAPENDFVHTDITGEFTVNNKTTIIKGFFAEQDLVKIRFYPAEPGNCTWKVVRRKLVLPEISGGVLQEGSGEILQEGSEEILPAAAGNHGMVKADDVIFRYEDGTYFYPFGTTVYALFHQPEELMEETFRTLEKAPFNKIRLCLFPKHFDFNRNEPELFAFEKDAEGNWDYLHPCFAFWDMLEEGIGRMDRMGMQVDLILFHPYDHWGFAHMTEEEALTYLDYALRRLSACKNIWWSLANEYDLLLDFTRERWEQIADFIGKNDPYRHLLSNHQIIRHWDFANKDTTHCCLQTSDGVQIPQLQRKFHKPVMFDEMGYEGNIPYNWGNLDGREMTHRFWNTVCFGGYATHGETFMEKMDQDQVLWWSKGGKLQGQSVERIRFLKDLMEELPKPMVLSGSDLGASFNTKEELKAMIDKEVPGFAGNNVLKLMLTLDDAEFWHIKACLSSPCIACGDQAILKYFGTMHTIYGTIELPKTGDYRVELIDSWNMTRKVVAEHANGTVEVEMPGNAGMAILGVKTGD